MTLAVNPNGKAVLQASFKLFRQDRRMMWLPAIAIAGSVATLVALELLSLVLFNSAVGAIVGAVLALVTSMFITVLCNVALVFAATDRIEGRTPTVRGSLAMAWARRGIIFQWSLLAVTVGTAIRALEERLGVFGSIVGFLGQVSWIIASYLVIPVLAYENVGPIDAVKRSTQVLKSKYGTVGRSGFRFGILFLVPTVVAIALAALGGSMIKTSPIAGVTVFALGLTALIGISIYAGAAAIYMRTILYRFAVGLPVPDLGVDLETIFTKSMTSGGGLFQR